MNVFDLSAKITMDINGYLKGMDTAKAVAVSTMGVIGGAVSGFMSDSINVGRGFDKSMSQVAATMGTTVAEMGREVATVDTQFGTFTGNLREYAQYMGRNTAFSATQAADALNYMALAGYDTQKSMEMLPNVLNLAAAGNMDLARASDMVTDTQTAFGIGTIRTKKLVDEMAKAASTGNTSVEQLGDAFLVVGGLTQELNGGMVKLKDGTTKTTDGVQEMEIALTAMANAGIKGSEAGTHMRNMILKLSSPTKEGAEQMEKLGVKVFDADGKMRSLRDIMGDLNGALGRLTQEEKIQAISDLFNARDLASAEALLNAVGQDWDKIGESILDAEGAASKMAEVQLDNLEGDITLFNSALEGLQIALSDAATPALREFTQMGTSLISAFTEGLQSLPEPLQTVIGMIGLVGGKAMEAAPQVLGMVSNLSRMAEAARIAGDETGGFAGKILNLGKTLLTNPIFLTIAGGIASVVTALASFKKNVEANTQAVREFREEATAFTDAVHTAADNVSEMAEEQISSANAADKLSQAQQNLSDLMEAQANAADMAAQAESEMNGEVARLTENLATGNVELDTTGQIFNALTNGAFGLGVGMDSIAETVKGYTESATDLNEVQDEANAKINEAQNLVSAYTVLSRDMSDAMSQASEETLNLLDVKSTEPEVYKGVCDAVDQLNQAHIDTVNALNTEVEETQAAMDALQEEYDNTYSSILQNLDSVIGVFDNVTAKTEMSVDDMISALDSQIAFMDQYAADIDKAMELTIDKGLIERLSDGSAESAAILHEIVNSGETNIAALNDKFGRVTEGKARFAGTLTSMKIDFNTRMNELNGRMDLAVKQLNKSDEAYKSGIDTIQGAINGANSMAGNLQTTYYNLGVMAKDAYREALDENSPSKEFEKSGIFTVQGAIIGVKKEKRNLERAYEDLAKAAIGSYSTAGAEKPDVRQSARVAEIMAPRGRQGAANQEAVLVLDGQVLGRLMFPYLTNEQQRVGIRLGGFA